MPLDSHDAVMAELDSLMVPCQHNLLDQLFNHPWLALRFRVLLRRSRWMWRHGREEPVLVRNVAGQVMQVPSAACWDIVAFRTYIDEAERRLLRYLTRTLHAGDTFIDAGANIGFFSCIAAAHVGATGQVLAFEPDETALAYLKPNASMLPQLRIVEAALTDRDGEIAFFRGAGNAMVSSSTVASHLDNRGIGDGATEVRVPAMRLDTFCAETGVRPKLMKVDVEGGEPALLRGARGVLEAGETAVVMEVSFDEFDEVADSSIAWLTDLGYAIHLIDAQGALRQVTLDQLRANGPELVKSKGYLHNLDNVVFQRV